MNSPARKLAFSINSMYSIAFDGRRGMLRRSDALPRITMRELLKSWATPPANTPRLSSFWASRSWASVASRSDTSMAIDAAPRMCPCESHKGVLKLLDAFSKNKEKLLFIGRGNLGPVIAERIKNNNLNLRIQYLDWVEDKWPYLRDAKAVIIPSLWPENCPLVALEAMSVGTPIICSDMGGTKEIVTLISPKLVLKTSNLEHNLRHISVPNVSRNHVVKIYKDNFSETSYLEKYLVLARGEQECI